MDIEFDPKKDASNLVKHGIRLARPPNSRPIRRSGIMASRKKADADNPVWTQPDFASARAPEDVLDPEVLSRFGKHRGPQKAPKKIPVSIRLNSSVVSHFREQGPGWQARIDAALTKIVEREKKAAPKQKRPQIRVR